MAKVRTYLHSLNVGEISAAGLARVDQERTRLAAEIQYNIFPSTIGKAQARPGTGFLGSSKDNARPRLLPFIKSISDSALLELTASTLRVRVNDVLIARAAVSSSLIDSGFSIDSTNLATAATITSSTLSSGSTANLVDGSASTGAVWNASATGTLTLDFGSAKTIYTLVLTATSTPNRAPNAFTVVGSATGAFAGEEVTVLTQTALANWSSTETRHFSIASPGSFRYYRLSLTNSQAGAASYQLSEIGSYETPWDLVNTGSATSSIASGLLSLSALAQGSVSSAKQSFAVSGTDQGVEHALRVVVSQGSVRLRIGSTSGGDEYLTETVIEQGTHSLAFTPTGTPVYVEIFSTAQRVVKVDSCTIESAGVMELPTPWGLSDLRKIRHDQSGDILFLACEGYRQKKIERRATNSWSVVDYLTDDGPFLATQTSDATITPSAIIGDITLTASRPLFRSSHVGALWELTSSGQLAQSDLSAENTFTSAIRVTGISNDRKFGVTRSGTWTGTVTLQRSFEGPTTGFVDVTTYTANGSVTFDDGLDNSEIWYRIGFKTGDYTSGTASLTLTYSAGTTTGVVRVLSYSSETSVTASVLSSLGGTSAMSEWLEGAWSDRRGWPAAVRFFDGRLYWAALDKYWGSVSDDYYSFDIDVEGDSGSIQRNIATGGSVASTRWMLGLQRLIFGTDSSEASARSSSLDEPLTPSNVTIKDASTQGVAPISPVKVDGRGIFVQRSNTRLFEISYNSETYDYDSGDITRLNEDIGGDGFLELFVQRQPETYIWSVRADGQCPILLYNTKEEVAGFIRFITDGASGKVVSGCTLPANGQDAVYLAVERTINGSTVHYIEKLAKHSEAVGRTTHLMADSYLTFAGPVTTISGLSHLEGQSVIVWGTQNGVTGKIGTAYTVSGGQITLSAAATNVVVGLPYTWRYKSSKLAYGAEGGTALLQKKKVADFGMLFQNTHPSAFKYGADFDHLISLPRIYKGKPLPANEIIATYDDEAFSFDGVWDTDARLCIEGYAPYPMTVLGLVLTVETNG
jgi:hypothetical protein